MGKTLLFTVLTKNDSFRTYSTFLYLLCARILNIRESLEILHEMDDSQSETTLIRSCLALPKFSYLICTCSPTYISQATRNFDVAMREALESILGGPLSEWSWLKASLPSSRGGVNLRSASLHVPAAFLASCSCSQTLVGEMLGRAPGFSPHISSMHCGCPLICCISTRLAVFGGYRRASIPTLSLACHR